MDIKGSVIISHIKEAVGKHSLFLKVATMSVFPICSFGHLYKCETFEL